jgi:hypothetical protein
MLDDPRFTLSQVAEAAGCQVGTLRSWLQRKHWRLDMAIGDSPAEVAGKAHLVTLRRALHIGASVELIRNDMDPARAFRAARNFVDVQDPSFDARASGGQVRNERGLFDNGYTLLVVYPDVAPGVIMWVDDTRCLSSSPLKDIIFPKKSIGHQSSGVFVWLNQIDRRIRTHLLKEGR